MRETESFRLWLKGLNPRTAQVYGDGLRRLFALADVTPDQVVASVTDGPNGFNPQAYTRLIQLANNFTEHQRHLSIYALRRYLFDHGVLMLPPVRMHKPANIRPPTRMTWEQAHAIAAAAGRPYNLCFKLMLECGWGIGEFLKFNTRENWEQIKRFLAKNDRAEYYRHDFASRKKNRYQFYSLIPVTVLKEIIAVVETPIKASRGLNYPGQHRTYDGAKGVVLNQEKYHCSTLYLENAWRTAKKRAPIQLTGSPTVHELRDTFRTRATQVECAPEAAEFAMGHSIDPLQYNKIFYDEKWIWKNLRKIENGIVTETDLQQRDETIRQLQQQINDLRASGLTREDIREMIERHSTVWPPKSGLYSTSKP
jgi:integrase